ncbi:MAG: acyl carrier protein [Clostridium sp.]|nr:acyl carrier protein [Clostridium sp.]
MVFEKIQEVIMDKMGLEKNEINLDSTFDDLGADSLDVVEIIMALEEEYDIEIDDEEAVDINTVGDVVNYLEGILVDD